MKLVFLLCLVTYTSAISVSEEGNEITVSGIQGEFKRELGLYPIKGGDVTTLTYSTNGKMDCRNIGMRIYKGTETTSKNQIKALCNDAVTVRTPLYGFTLIFDADNKVSNGAFNIKVSAPNGIYVTTTENN